MVNHVTNNGKENNFSPVGRWNIPPRDLVQYLALTAYYPHNHKSQLTQQTGIEIYFLSIYECLKLRARLDYCYCYVYYNLH